MRCGTTSLAAYLETHPDVCLAKDKEAHWFDTAEVQAHGIDETRWDELFAHYSGERVVLDATPIYMFMQDALDALTRHNPHVRVIVILRDPAERARSHHALISSVDIPLGPYWWALLAERRRMTTDTDPMFRGSPTRLASLRARGRYAEQIRNVRSRFPDALILRFDEMINDPEATGRRVTDFLRIDPFPTGASLPWINERSINRWPSPIDAVVRWSLRRDIRATEDLLGWERGVLGGSRLRGKWRERPFNRPRASRVVRVRRRLGRLRSRLGRQRRRLLRVAKRTQ